LDPSDPNFEVYADGESRDQPVKYYIKQAEKMKTDEKVTMFIDYIHLTQFKFQKDYIIEKITQEYNRYEGYLRRALSQFLNDLGH